MTDRDERWEGVTYGRSPGMEALTEVRILTASLLVDEIIGDDPPTEVLDDRRLTTVEVVEIDRIPVRFDYGWTRDGRIAELFGEGADLGPGHPRLRHGAALETWIKQSCCLVSWLIEHGETLEEIHARLGRLVPGALLLALERGIKLEAEAGALIADAYRWARSA